MSELLQKIYPTIGCCGVCCGLCPRLYIEGSSRCPGCCGLDFFNKHPSCAYVTCCVKKKKLEVCAQCDEFPCSKFQWLDDGQAHDSFVTHRMDKFNHEFVRNYGIERFVEHQNKRINLLKMMLKDYDDSRSKYFYCLAAALLSIEEVEEALHEAKQKIAQSDDKKTRAKVLKGLLNDCAMKENVELRLKKG